MNNKELSVSNALLFGTHTTQRHFWFLFRIILIYLGIFFSPLLFRNTHSSFFQILISGLVLVLSTVASLGLTRISLNFYDKKPSAIQDLFVLVHLFIRYLICSLMYYLIILIGLLLFIIPGIIWAVRFHLFEYVLVDKELGPLEAFKLSYSITKGKVGILLKFLIISFLLQIGGLLAAGVGIFVTLPVVVLAHGFIYRKLANNKQSSQQN